MSKLSSFSFHQLTAFLLVLIFSQNFSAFAQIKKVSAAQCSGAWTGVITYTRTQTVTNNKTVERVSERGRDTTNFEMNYDYTATVGVTGSSGANVGKAVIDHKMTSTETVSAIESNSCDRGKTWNDMRGDSTSKNETTANERAEANFNVGVNDDGTYSVSVGVPQVKGKVGGSQTTSFSGQCTTKEGKSLTFAADRKDR